MQRRSAPARPSRGAPLSRSRAPRLALILSLGTATSCAGDDSAGTGATLSGTTTGSPWTTSAGPGSASESDTDTAAEPACGDGQLDADEECDDGPQNGDAAACTAACARARCGDGLLGPGEACDDGPLNDDAALCTSACQIAVCGDGLVLGAGGAVEECDNGRQNGVGQLCSADCKINTCGDGDLGPGEACDDGNKLPGDGCSPACQSESCGNGVIDDGELCDDGQNGDNDDGCTDLCTLPTCGDGLVQPSLGEQCDDQNTQNADACSNLCHHTPKGLQLSGLTPTPLFGNQSGGTLYEDACPQGEALVGVAGWLHTFAGWHGRIQALCGSPGLAPGDLFTVAVGGGATLPMRGLIGDLQWTRTCPQGQVVIGFQGRAQGLLDQLVVRCAPLLISEGPGGFALITGAETSLPPIGGDSGDLIPLTKCSTGAIAKAARIRAGDFIDAFGLACAEISLTY